MAAFFIANFDTTSVYKYKQNNPFLKRTIIYKGKFIINVVPLPKSESNSILPL